MIYKVFLLFNIVIAVTGQFLVKLGMKKIGLVEINLDIFEKFKRMAMSPYLWLAVMMYFISFTLYAIILSKVELNRAYPVAVLGAIVLTFIISVIFFNETFNVFKIIGLVLCIVGLVFLFR